VVTIEDRLGLVRYNADVVAHIKIDAAACRDCAHHVCITICPAGCYTVSDDANAEVLFSYTGCLECGTCRVMCEHIEWEYPLGGCGVSYRFT
jgi:ferredoxin like protein